MANYTWIYDGAQSRWDYASNWTTDDPTPTYPGAGDTAVFNGTHVGGCQCYNAAYPDAVTNAGGYTGTLNLRRSLTTIGDFIWRNGALTGSYGLNVGGNCDLTGCTYAATIGLTLNTAAGASKTLTATQTFGNLMVNGGAGSTLHIAGSLTASLLMAEGVGSLQVDSGTPTVTGTLDLITGTFDAGTIDLSGALSMGGFGGGAGTVNWTQAGDISWNAGGVTANLPGLRFNSNRVVTIPSWGAVFAETDVVQGTVSFSYDTPADAYEFTNGKTFTVRSGAILSMTGAAGTLLTLREKAGGSATWALDNQAGSTVAAAYVDVKGSVASRDITPTYSTDSGGNVHWVWPGPAWRVTNPLFGGIHIPSTEWSVIYDAIGDDVSVDPDGHAQAWTREVVGTPTHVSSNGLFALATTNAAHQCLYHYDDSGYATYTGAYIETLVKVATSTSAIDKGVIVGVELGDAAGAAFIRAAGVNLMGASNVAKDMTGWHWVRLGVYGAETRLWIDGTLVQAYGVSYLTSNKRALFGISDGRGPANATFRYVQARPMWGGERLWSDALMTIGPFSITCTDLAAAADGSSYHIVQVNHATDAAFSLAEPPVFAMAGHTYIYNAGVLVELLGECTGSTFEVKVTNLSYTADGGYGTSAPDINLTWTRTGLVEP